VAQVPGIERMIGTTLLATTPDDAIGAAADVLPFPCA
jgi:hypothetical protein